MQEELLLHQLRLIALLQTGDHTVFYKHSTLAVTSLSAVTSGSLLSSPTVEEGLEVILNLPVEWAEAAVVSRMQLSTL
jgi:hypothetical protein